MCEKIKSRLSCPVCAKTLNLTGRTYSCENSHSFDMAKSGYVNLLLSNRMNAKAPGDNKLMVKARTDFLEKGYYSNLLEAVTGAVREMPGDIKLLDAGCGEGYYTGGVYNTLKSDGRNISAVGIDISKFALNSAAKRFHGIEFAVGSVFHIPVQNSSCNVLLNIFAPFCHDEFIRVLSDGGYMIMVVPGRRHLWQLKSIVYDNPYENELKDLSVEGFSLAAHYHEHRKINLENICDIMSLFSMTPYFYKTGEKDKNKLEALEALETETEFEILVYKKEIF
ncbi:MAG: putative RNA methyltransferase [Porcipelethomonas sp.]